MDINEVKTLCQSIMRTTGRICIPWTLNFGKTEEYRKGWNDCVKRARLDRDKFIKEMNKTINKY